MIRKVKKGTNPYLKYGVLIGLLVVLFIIAMLWFKKVPSSDPIWQSAVPKLSEQPKDTLVATKSLQLHHWKTHNDVDVYFAPTEALPIVDIRIDFAAGSGRDGQNPGLSQMTALMLQEGTRKLTTDEFSDTMDGYGAIYNVSVDRDRFGINLRAMANKDLDAVVTLVTEMITEPRFAAQDFQRIKQQWLVKLEQDLQKPSLIAQNELYKIIYADHPYAHPIEGTAMSIQAMTEQDLHDFHQTYLNANNVVITIVGGIHRDKARQLATKIVAALPQGTVLDTLPVVLQRPLQKESQVAFASKQSHVMMGQLGRRANDDERYPLIVGNHILGGMDMVARLFQTVREERGLAYSVYSYFNPLKEMGPFVVSLHTQGQNTNEAVSIMRDVLKDFVTNGPTEEELAAAKLYLVGSFPLQLGSNGQMLDLLSHLAFYKLPYDFLDQYTTEIQKVSVEDIQRVFQKRIHPDEMTLVIVGGKKI